jgi:hypothetical protein
MEQNVGGSPSSVMDKIQHWLKDVRGDLASSVKKMCYINENIKILKSISILPFLRSTLKCHDEKP